jgi:dolichol-phosphate mannosyltransferase
MGLALRPLVVIPTYNERDNLGQLIPVILGMDGGFCVLIVDDGSPDGTAAAVLDLKEQHYGQRLFLEARAGKMGLGSAYVHGLTWGLAAGHDFLIQMDADWSHHPKYLETMLRLAREADFVIGSRYVEGGGTNNWGAGRRLLSRFGSLYARLILRAGIADFTGGFNGWAAEILRKVGLDAIRSDGYSFQIEMKYRAHRLGYRHIEFPILFDQRRAGKSKMSASIALEAFWRVWELKLMGGKKARRMVA